MVEKLIYSKINDKTALKNPMVSLVNLSSYPTDQLIVSLAKISQGVAGRIRTIPLNQIGQYVEENGEVKFARRRKTAWIVVDADDRMRNIKIRNVKIVQQIVAAGVIEIGEPTALGSYRVSGINLVMTNFHNSRNVRIAMGSPTTLIDSMEDVKDVTIITTTDGLTGHSNGLKNYIAERGLVYNEVIRGNVAPFSWLTCREADLERLKVKDRNIISDTIMQNDKTWQYKQGYTSHLYTLRGPKEVTIEEQGKSKINIFAWFMKGLIALVYAILSLCGMVEKEKPKEKQKTGLAFAVVSIPTYMTTIIAYIYAKWLPSNADKEVDKANAMIASWQISKMASKSTSKSSKAELLDQPSKTFAAYLVGTTNLNSAEAKLSADLKVAKDNQKKETMALLITTLINMVSAVVIGKTILIIPLAVLATIGYLFKRQPSMMLISGIISPTNWISKAILSIVLMAEETNAISDSLKKKIYPLILAPTVLAQVIYSFF